jgi:hypothetical protein
MEPAQIVTEELRLGSLGDRALSKELQQALDRHCASLAALVGSLQKSGKDRGAICALVATMLRSYEDELIQALEESE